MKWTVGLDLRAPSAGAIRFAAWLARHGHEPAQVRGVHVVAQGGRRENLALRLRPAPKVQALAKRSADALLERAEASDAFGTVTAPIAPSVVDGLADAANRDHADALIIGKLADKRARLGPRLGPSARRTLRRLPVPVMVVPPTLKTSEIGTGPILLATDMSPQARSAAVVALRLAVDLGREVHALHVATPMEDYGPLYLPDTLRPGVAAAYEQSCRDALNRWGHDAGIMQGKGEVKFGEAIESILQVAYRTDALAIVCGSRRLTTFARLFGHSLASDLAAHADRPVLVVPPDAAAPTSEVTVKG